MAEIENTVMSHCPRCGGERFHSVIAKEQRSWRDMNRHEDEAWSIVECRGCREITFVYDYNDYENPFSEPVRRIYPPAPSRKKPEWGNDFYLALGFGDFWVYSLHSDIYEALGLEAYSLAAMGTRTIVDFVVTSKAGDYGTFKEKLDRLKENSWITAAQVDVIFAAFDAGSAAAHRGHSPKAEEVSIMLSIAETLFEQVFINPLRHKKQAEDAAKLRSNTPQRPKQMKGS